MPSKLQAYCQMADHAAKQITGSSENWKAFLRTAARLYKYPYNEQVMIHAQRPDATACAEYDFWNERMGRYVRRGSTGIALVDVSADKPRLKYVFDVSDTGGREFPRRRFLWELEQEHFDSVTAMLERNYDVSGEDGLALQLERVAAQLADEYWNDHQRDILGIVDDSFLEEYDDFNIGVAFRNAAVVSITYSLMSRCGLEPDEYFEHEDFLSIFDFNTPPLIAALGTAVSESSQQVLRQIEVTVKNYERERSADHDRNDIHEERRLSDSRPETERSAGGEPRQVRQDAEEIPEGASPDPVEQHDSQRDAVPAPAGDRADGTEPAGADDAEAGAGGGRDGEPESQRPDEVGGADEQLQGAGGGDHPAGAGVQLNPFGEPQEGEQLALFPSEAEQIKSIAEAEELSSSAFSMPPADKPETPANELPADFAYNAVKEHHPDDIVLFQVGDFFEMYGEDAKTAAELLGLHLTTRPVSGTLRVEMCGIPAHVLERYVEKLREQYGVTISAVGEGNTRNTYSLAMLPQKGAQEMRDAVDSGKQLSDFAKGDRVKILAVNFPNHAEYVGQVGTVSRTVKRSNLVYIDLDNGGSYGSFPANIDFEKTREQTIEAAPTIRELYDYYKPIVFDALLKDTAYLNACRNSDRETAYLEGAAAIKRAINGADDLQLTKLYYDVSEFHNRLHREVLNETYPLLSETPYQVTQEDIDDVLREWNGDIESKRRVVRYMQDHAREKETAAWLAREYGQGYEDAGPFFITVTSLAGMPPTEPVKLTWAKMQRRIAQLIREDQFFTEQEKAVQTRDYSFEYQLLDRLRTDCDYFLGAGGRSEKHLWAGNVYDQIKKMRELYDTLPEKPEWLTKEAIDDYASRMAARYEVVVYHHFENGFDERLDYQTLKEAKKVAQGYVDGTMEDDGFRYDGAAVYDLQEKQWLHIVGDFPLEDASSQPVLGVTEKDSAEQLTLDSATSPKISAKSEPSYKVGDTVYLDDTAFLIDEIRDREVSLRDPTLAYPIFRAENRENFARLLQRDARNSRITDFLFADLASADGDLLEVLGAENGLLSSDEKEVIASWFHAGDGNSQIAALLSEMTSDRAETMELVTGETADFFTSAAGMEINILDSDENKKAALFFQWREVAAVLRAYYQANTLTVSHETSIEEIPAPEIVQSETVAVYPTERNHLPHDVIIERLHIDEPAQAPAAENFRITDNNLGVGGAKTKFRRNIEAITLLHELEFDGRQATPEEQEVLSRYVGWGGLADAFDETKENWADEFKELYVVLSPEEYKAAKASTLNAHYTSPTVIKAIYKAIGGMGFQTGNILEPAMGVGNFFGCLPEEMSKSRLYGVELDSITGRIAKQLYPQANITVAGFETTDRRDFYDLAIGNVPFGQYTVNDRAYNKLGFSIHDYFFAKSLDQVRPGGIVAFVTSRYTMDKQSPEVRRYIAQRAELLGAIRLPNNAFKANAGTEVVSDIIFLQKRDRPIDIEPDWVHLGQNEDGFAINSYFLDHPEMMLGTPTSESTQYGRQDFTLAPIEGADLAAQLHEAVQHITGEYWEAELPDLGEDEEIRDTIPADPDVKNYSYTLVDGEVYFRENSVMVRPDLNATAKERVKGIIALRDCVHALIDLQMDEYAAESAIKEKQAELNTLYDAYTAKYGIISSRGNKLAFSDDSAYYLLCSLEVLDDDGNFERKADMFTKRTIRQQRSVTSVDTASEALAVSIGERAKVDLPFMAQLTGKTEDEITKELNGVIFHDPIRQEWQTADEHLSGKVRLKLRQARRAAEHDPAYQRNVEALEQAQPVDLDASEIEMRLGVDWLDASYIQQFMVETFHTPPYLHDVVKVEHSKFTAEWHIDAKGRIPSNDVAAFTTYGTERASAYEILEDSLNLRDTRIYDTVEDPDGKERRVLNAKETTLAAQKQQAIKDAFKDWIWKDPERRQTLVAWYNENMNGTRPREYDGSHIVFSGMNPEIELREHQKSAIAHILYGGNTLLAHEVGAGKTFEMVAACMESKRLGLSSKAIIVVPNHLTEQWASEFLRLYPSANLLVTTKKDFEKSRRKKFCARIATGDYDAVIIGHSQFERIPISVERQERLLQDQITEIEIGLRQLEMEKGEHFSVKQMERTKKSLEARLEKLQADHKKDDVVTFEQLGVDRMFVDESDNYKNLFLYTKMRNVAGLSTSDAQKSSDMYNKCRYMDELTGGRGVVFATGTPVSNSMTELYTIQRYLQYDRLQEMGMTHFDCWASRFGETTTALELAPEGYTFFRWKKYIPLNL